LESKDATGALRHVKGSEVQFGKGWRLGGILFRVFFRSDGKRPAQGTVTLQPPGTRAFRRTRFEKAVHTPIAHHGPEKDRDAGMVANVARPASPGAVRGAGRRRLDLAPQMCALFKLRVERSMKRRVAFKTSCLPAATLDDRRQDLLVDVLCRLPGFDARRGSLGAFANVVLRNRCSRIAIRHHRQRRAQGGALRARAVPLAGTRAPIGDTLTEDDGLAARAGQPSCAIAVTERHHALQSALGRLPVEDCRFCAALAHRPVTALAAEGFGSRSALCRRLADLRPVLTAHGPGPARDDLAAA
jgi:RNA polymerase sigma-70 factor (ECF subfamily)